MNTDERRPNEPLPQFDSYIELGEFWDSHSLVDYWDQTEETYIEFGPKAIRKPSLFGSVQVDGITDKVIEETKRDLLRDLDDL